MYKLVSRDRDTGRQVKKRIYETLKSFNTYAFDTSDRYSNWYKIELYEMIDDKWKLIIEFKDKEEFKRIFEIFEINSTFKEVLQDLKGLK